MTNKLSIILPYLIIAAFVIFAVCMTVEVHDINTEMEQFKQIIADYKNAELHR